MLDKAIIHRILCGLASKEEMQSVKQDDLIAIKSDKSEMHYRFLPRGLSVEQPIATCAAEDKKGSRPRYKHIASDESTDAVGDRIRVKGWVLTRFAGGRGQLLWAHDQRGLPLGNVSKAWKGRVEGEPALLTMSEFHDADENPQSPLVEKLVARGALPGVSVGFIPIKMVWPESEEERKSLKLGPFGVEHVEQELLELSVVPVPANSNALRVKAAERAKDIFDAAKKSGMAGDLIEEIQRVLNLTEESERALRRRMILVPDMKFAVAEVLRTMPGTETPEPEEGSEDPPEETEEGAEESTETEAAPAEEPEGEKSYRMRLDDESLDALRGLTAALTKTAPTDNGTDATAADPESDDASPVPADHGGDFMARVAAHAAQKLTKAGTDQ